MIPQYDNVILPVPWYIVVLRFHSTGVMSVSETRLLKQNQQLSCLAHHRKPQPFFFAQIIGMSLSILRDVIGCFNLLPTQRERHVFGGGEFPGDTQNGCIGDYFLSCVSRTERCERDVTIHNHITVDFR